jgi:hypothetical protein
VTGSRPWALLALMLILGTVIVWAVFNERAQRRRKRQLAQIQRSQRHAAEHNPAEAELYTLELYPGSPDTYLITDCPMVNTGRLDPPGPRNTRGRA